MDIKELSKGYFEKTYDEQMEIVHLVTRYYIEDMMVSEGSLPILRVHLKTLQERSLINEDYEVSEILSEIINGINQILREENSNV